MSVNIRELSFGLHCPSKAGYRYGKIIDVYVIGFDSITVPRRIDSRHIKFIKRFAKDVDCRCSGPNSEFGKAIRKAESFLDSIMVGVNGMCKDADATLDEFLDTNVPDVSVKFSIFGKTFVTKVKVSEALKSEPSIRESVKRFVITTIGENTAEVEYKLRALED